MLDLGWTEIFLIAGIAVLVIAPKDLPKAMRSVGKYVGQLKQMARGFQTQLSDALKEADLEDIQKGVESIKKVDPFANLKKEITKVGSDIKDDLKVLDKSAASTVDNSGSGAGSSAPSKSTVAAANADQPKPAKGLSAAKSVGAAKKSAGAAESANGTKPVADASAAKKAPRKKSPAKPRKSASAAKPSTKKTAAKPAKPAKPANTAKKSDSVSGEAKA